MEKSPSKPMTPLDELVNPPFLYIMKLLIPYVPLDMQRTCAIFLKFFELRRTMEYFYGFGNVGREKASGNILSDLKPYMDKKEQEMMEQVEGMMNMMEMAKHMQEFQEPPCGGEGSAPSPLDFMKGMMGEEERQMFEMYSSMFEQAGGGADFDEQKGKSEHGGMDFDEWEEN